MKVIDEIGIKFDRPFSGMVGAKCGVGKTNLLVVLTNEILNKGKSVLFVSSDEPERSLYSKFSKVVNRADMIAKNCSLAIVNSQEPIKKIEKILSELKFDVVVLDCYDVKLEDIRKLKLDGVSVLITQQLSMNFENQLGYFIEYPFSNVNRVFESDFAIVLSNNFKLNFIEKIKWFFKGKKPNINLNVIKNRFGNEFNHKIFLNHENLSIL